MDTEKTLDLNKPLFSYSRYERNEYGYGDDFIHRDGDGVDMQVFFNQATGKDNIIQFAPRQNGKDIPSSKGTSLASKSQKYVAMANALNAASKSYVYRNEVAR